MCKLTKLNFEFKVILKLFVMKPRGVPLGVLQFLTFQKYLFCHIPLYLLGNYFKRNLTHILLQKIVSFILWTNTWYVVNITQKRINKEHVKQLASKLERSHEENVQRFYSFYSKLKPNEIALYRLFLKKVTIEKKVNF